MILADTSIVVELLRTRSPRLQSLVVSNSAAICGPTRTEILHATRDAKHRQQLITALGLFQQISIPDSLWDEAGDNLAALRTAGTTVSLADVLIATVAISNNLELWTRDQDFTLMQKVLPTLRLFQEPP